MFSRSMQWITCAISKFANAQSIAARAASLAQPALAAFR
jgi:hypothetical protein